MRIAPSRRKEVYDQQMDALVKQFGGILDEGPQRVSARLVARRNDFNHGHDAVATHVPDGDTRLFAAEEFKIRLGGWLHLCCGDQHAGVGVPGRILQLGIRSADALPQQPAPHHLRMQSAHKQRRPPERDPM